MRRSRVPFVGSVFAASAAAVLACSDSTGPVIASITIDPATLTIIGLGTTGQLTATVLDPAGRPIPNARVRWIAENPSVATVTGIGLQATVTAVSIGTALIRANAGAMSAMATVTAQGRVLGVTISSPPLALRVGQTVQLVATVAADAGLSRAVTWQSASPNVATVSTAGLVTALARGTANMTARAVADSTKSASVPVQVLGVASVTVSPKTSTLPRGSILPMIATVVTDSGVSDAILWRSTNINAVGVSSTGSVRARTPGRAFVIATATAEPAKADSAEIIVPNACLNPATYTLGSTMNGAISIDDCEGNNDFLNYTTNGVTLFSATLSSAMMLGLFPLSEVHWITSVDASGSTTGFALVGPGAHQLVVSTVGDSTRRGSYTLSSAVEPSFPVNCPMVWATPGVTRSFPLEASCPGNRQRFVIAVPANTNFRVTAVAATFPARIDLMVGAMLLATASATGPNAPATLTYTSPTTINVTQLFVLSKTPGVFGSFTITIDP